MHSGALEAVDRILNRGGDPDEVLRAVVAALHARAFAWIAVASDDDGSLRIRAEAGQRRDTTLRAAVVWRGTTVGELLAAPLDAATTDDDRRLLERVAVLVSAHFSAAREADPAR